MSNSSGNPKDYAFAAHAEAFQVLIDVFNSFSIRYFLIGAQARDLHFYQKGIKPARGTRDIDFAVMVEDMPHYLELLNTLKQRGFDGTIEPYRLIWKKGDTVIDLLPFGQIEQDYTVNFNEREMALSVLGYREINEELEEIELAFPEQTISIPVPPLHGLFLLKLLSWDDKKSAREKDLKDLNQILNHYWEFVEEEAYEKHTDLFNEDDFRMDVAAARILGRHLHTTLEKSDLLRQKIIQILREQAAQTDPPGPMVGKMARERDQSPDDIKRVMDAVLVGVEEV